MPGLSSFLCSLTLYPPAANSQ